MSRHGSQAGRTQMPQDKALGLWEDGEGRVAAGQVEKYLSRESLGTMLCRGHVITHLARTRLSAESHIKKMELSLGQETK